MASTSRRLEPTAPADGDLLAVSDVLQCPTCAAGAVAPDDSGATLVCQYCAAPFPVTRSDVASIPWLFPDPVAARLQWKARYNGFLHRNSQDLERLRLARSRAPNGTRARRRINQLLQARERYRNQVTGLMEPFGLEHIDWPADSTDLLRSRLPWTQGLSGYVSNVFRDWCWDNGETDAMFGLVEDLLPSDDVGSILTLGAGACRLPYDLHRRFRPDSSTVLDLNPMLLEIAARTMCAEDVSLYEFPLAPLGEAAVLQRCSAPAALDRGDIRFVLGDAIDMPFVARSFDTVVTPWLIDIIAHDLRLLVQRINHCLADGGVWINTGSLAFFHQNELWRYSEEEVRELIGSLGFEVLSWERRLMPYLQSPHSAQRRFEEVLSFAVRKIAHTGPPDGAMYLPDWILDPSLPVPASADAAISSSNFLLKAQVFAAIDGKQTIKQIGRSLARQYGLGKAETIHAVRQILIDEWEHTQSRQFDADL